MHCGEAEEFRRTGRGFAFLAGVIARLLGPAANVIVAYRRLIGGYYPKLPARGFVGVGAGASLLSALAGSTEPVTTPCFLAYGLTKATYIGTVAAATVITHVFKLAAYGSNSLLSMRELVAGLLLTPCMFVGSWLGKRILERLSERIFVVVIEVVMIVRAGPSHALRHWAFAGAKCPITAVPSPRISLGIRAENHRRKSTLSRRDHQPISKAGSSPRPFVLTRAARTPSPQVLYIHCLRRLAVSRPASRGNGDMIPVRGGISMSEAAHCCLYNALLEDFLAMLQWFYILAHLLIEAGAARRDVRIRFLKAQVEIVRRNLDGNRRDRTAVLGPPAGPRGLERL